MVEKQSKNKLILFGAGWRAQFAIKYYGEEIVGFLCDNDKEKHGKFIYGVKVISFEEMLELHKKGYVIVVTPYNYAFMVGQLEEAGVYDYLLYRERYPWVISFQKDDIEENRQHNQQLNGFINEYADIDLLEDVGVLKSIVKNVMLYHASMKRDLVFAYNYLSENHYGNTKVLLDYAGIAQEEEAFFPITSHFDCLPIYSVRFYYNTAVVFSGNYFKRQVNQTKSFVPVFTVGPYIYYAQNIYGGYITKKKSAIGKMLLVFLPHSLENTERKYGREKFIDAVMSSYQDGYDSIWLCVYWADINDAVCDYARKQGMHVVSAGLRWDPLFDNRLKTMLELADGVVCGDIGTFVSYAIQMGKPIARIEIGDTDAYPNQDEYKNDVEVRMQFGSDFKKYIKGFHELFDEKLKITDAQRDWMNPYAGFDCIRNREYMRTVWEISKDIWIQCQGNVSQYKEAVIQTYRIYEMKKEFYKMSLLKEAVGQEI